MELLENIRIKGYKCFIDNSFTLKPLTLLAGINSVGKSSFIQSLLLSRALTEKLRSGDITLSKSGTVEKKVNVLLNNIFGLELGNSSEVHARDALSNEILFQFTFSDKKIDLLFKNNSFSSELYLQSHSISNFEELVASPLNSQCFYYLNAERVGPRSSSRVIHQEYIHAGWKGEYAIHAFSQYSKKRISINEKKLFALKGKEVHDSSFRNQVNEWMNYIIPGIDIQALIHDRINQIEVSINNSSPTNVGFGISYLLPIILNGLLAPKGSICVIENPEAHLHPLGQARIGSFLAQVAASGVQVIIETHSEHVINGIRLSYMQEYIPKDDIIIHFLRRDEGSDEIKNDEIELSEFGDLTAYPKGFIDQVDDDLMELIKYKQDKMFKKK